MIVEIDFNSDEAIYIQLRNQIIIGIATERLREGRRRLPCVNWPMTSGLTCIR